MQFSKALDQIEDTGPCKAAEYGKASQALEDGLDCFQITVTLIKRIFSEPDSNEFHSDTSMKVSEKLITTNLKSH